MSRGRKGKELPQQFTIKRNETQPEAGGVLARAILDVADAGAKLLAGPLKDSTIILLLHEMTGVAKRDIKKILDAAPQIARTYLKRDF